MDSLGSEQQTFLVKGQMGNLLGSVGRSVPILLLLQGKSSHRWGVRERVCCASIKFSLCISHHVHMSQNMSFLLIFSYVLKSVKIIRSQTILWAGIGGRLIQGPGREPSLPTLRLTQSVVPGGPRSNMVCAQQMEGQTNEGTN